MCEVLQIVSGAASLGVFFLIFSGVCYVVLVGLKRVGNIKVSLETNPSRNRTRNVSSVDEPFTKHVLSETRPAGKCDSYNLNGSLSTGNQYQRDLKETAKDLEEPKNDSSGQEDTTTPSKTVEIREHIEKLVEKLVGGSLDGVSVGKLSKDDAYLGMFSEHHDSLCQGLARLGFALHLSILSGHGSEMESPKAAHSDLKILIQKIISEAMKLPDLKDETLSADGFDEDGEHDITDKSYEDVLATAILNKVIEQCQERRQRLNAKKQRKRVDRTSKSNGIEYDMLDDEDSDWSDNSRSERLSLTIEEHIEEITTAYEHSDEEEPIEELNTVSAIQFPESGRIIRNGFGENHGGAGEEEERSWATELVTTGNSWEENWLFQKKRLRSMPNAHHPVPVPMLVPNPSQDYRALIGGVDADDLSDMSDCSDSALEDVVHAGDDDAIVDGATGVEYANEEAPEEVEEPVPPESLTSSPSESSCPSLSQKERDISVDYEYVQKIDLEPVAEPPVPLPRTLECKSSGDDLQEDPPRCRIAEREKEKWEHPVYLANNPYSAENILKRDENNKRHYVRIGSHSQDDTLEFRSVSPTEIAKERMNFALYGRDYYVKASRCPTGDPSVRLTAVNQSFESSVEVSDNSTGESCRRSRESPFTDGSARGGSIKEPIADIFTHVERRKHNAKIYRLPKWATFGATESGGSNRYGSHSLRLPSRQAFRPRVADELADLEHSALRQNIYHVVLRARDASPNFVLNPLFEDSSRDTDDGDCVSASDENSPKRRCMGQESGYGSDSVEGSSDSSEFWRLTPPETPEMLESSLVTASQLRQNKSDRLFDTFPRMRRTRQW